MSPDIQYRWLYGIHATDEEWNRIESILAARGWTSLNRNTAFIRVAEEQSSGKLVGFLVCQNFPHIEPLFIIPSARGQGIAERLADDMVEFLGDIRCRGWEITADSPFAEKLAQAHGMRKLESPVYRTV